MAQIRKTILVEPKIDDEIKAPHSFFSDDINLYICHIEGDLLYISTEKNAPKNECETFFAEDCYIIGY